MNEPIKVTHHLEIHTENATWCGELILAAPRRVSDYLNDGACAFLPLQRVTLETSHPGAVRPQRASLEAMAVNKRSIIVAFSNPDVEHAAGDLSDRVPRVRHRVLIYAPPFALQGDIHLARGVYLLDALNVLRQDFLAVTDVTVWWIDSPAPVATGLPFVAVNRRWIGALHPTCPRPEIPLPELQSLSAPMAMAG